MILTGTEAERERVKCIEVKKKDLDGERVSQKPSNINLAAERKRYGGGGVRRRMKKSSIREEYCILKTILFSSVVLLASAYLKCEEKKILKMRPRAKRNGAIILITSSVSMV